MGADRGGTGHDATVVVIGGGPAGLAAALSLSRLGVAVAVLEAGDYSGEAAGDTLRADGRVLLADLGVTEAGLAGSRVQGRGINAVWADDKPRAQVFDGTDASWHLLRPAFDRALADAAVMAGVGVERRVAFETATRDGAIWRVVASRDGRKMRASARYLIDATGRASRLARSLGERRLAFDRLVATWDALEPQSGTVASSRLLLEADADGWWYSAPQADGRMLVSLVTDADILARAGPGWWREALSATGFTRRRIGAPSASFQPRLRPASVGRLSRAAGDGWLAVGDAAASLDPLSGAGLIQALQTGAEAGAAIAADLGGDAGALRRYAESVSLGFARHLAERARYFDRVEQFAPRLFWRRRRPPKALSRVSVEPMALLRASGRRSRETMARMEGLIALRDIAALRASWAEPIEAHRIVADLKRNAAAPIDDRRAIATLQRLIVDHALEFA